MGIGRISKMKHDKERYHNSKDNGICTYCRKTKAEEGMTQCKECRKKTREKQREKYKNKFFKNVGVDRSEFQASY